MVARIRSVKPDILLDSELFDAEKETGLPLRFAFIGLWCHADREGRFRWKPRELKHGILPYDDLDFEHVLDALAARGWIVRYEVAGRVYGWVRTFTEHQHINGREADSVLPEPPPLASPPPEVQEEKGREGKACEPHATPASSTRAARVNGTRLPPGLKGQILSAWNLVAAEAGWCAGRSIARDRLTALQARWRDPDWREHWAAALKKAAPMPFLRGENDRGWKANLDWFLRPGTVNAILEEKYAGDAAAAPDRSAWMETYRRDGEERDAREAAEATL